MLKLCLKIVLELAQKGWGREEGEEISYQLLIVFLFQFKSIKSWNTQGKNKRKIKPQKSKKCSLLMSVCKGWTWV